MLEVWFRDAENGRKHYAGAMIGATNVDDAVLKFWHMHPDMQIVAITRRGGKEILWKLPCRKGGHYSEGAESIRGMLQRQLPEFG